MRVTPRSAKPGVGGWREQANGQRALEVRVAEAPTDGAANRAVIRLLADRLDLAPSTLSIIAGHASRTKRVELPLDEAALERLLA